MRKSPLILSSLAYDIHASSVRWGLQQSGVRAIWAHSPAEDVPPISLHCDGSGPWRASGWLDDETVGSVWFRRSRSPEEFPRAQERDRPFLRTEWQRFMRNLYALSDELSDRLWVNRPASAIRAENKLVQLQAARRCGVRFPPTLVSHDPVAIRRFVAVHGRVVYKTFMPHTWKDAASGRMFSTFASMLEPDMLADDDSLSLCPGIYQAFVPKKRDLRVIAIGDRLFTVSLSSITGEAFVDWRAHTYEPELKAEAVVLPGAYQAKLQTLMQELGLVFGCIDLVVDAGGEVHFLEVNQAGQFLFIEQLVDSMPLLRAMCAMLAEGRTDYSLDAIADLSYQTYCASDHHQKWWEGVRDQMDAASQEGAWLTIEP
ncbi:MAG TPA: hypothetical protein VNO33_13970 [Kofleriaceae bacterium]|nr:hypothetical protein [Kofleriaceae bacterium]